MAWRMRREINHARASRLRWAHDLRSVGLVFIAQSRQADLGWARIAKGSML